MGGQTEMNRLKMDRNIYFFVGFVFLLSTFLSLRYLQLHELTTSIRIIAPILTGIASIITFINAHISHKKIVTDSKN